MGKRREKLKSVTKWGEGSEWKVGKGMGMGSSKKGWEFWGEKRPCHVIVSEEGNEVVSTKKKTVLFQPKLPCLISSDKKLIVPVREL